MTQLDDFRDRRRIVGIGRFRDIRHVLRNHPHLDRRETARSARPSPRWRRRRAHRADFDRLRGPHQQQLGRQRSRRFRRVGRRLERHDDLRLRFGEREFASRLFGVGGSQIPGAEGDLGVVLNRTRIEARHPLSPRRFISLSGLKGGTAFANSFGVSAERSLQAREGALLDDLLVANLDRRRNPEGLFVGDDVDGAKKSVALSGAYPLLPGLAWRGAGEFRRFGEIGFAVEIEIERRADERDAGKAGERRADQPPQGRPAALCAVQPVVAQSDRRLDAKLESGRSSVAWRHAWKS